MATTKNRTRTRKPKSKPETNGIPEPEQYDVPGFWAGDGTGREKVKYEKHWSDYYWQHRVEAHETLVPFRERVVEFLHTLEDAGIIKLLDYGVVEHDEENSENWEADKMQFTFNVLDKNGEPRKLGLPVVSITLAAEGSR